MEPTIGSEDRIFGEIQVAPDYKKVICFIESLKMKLGLSDDYSIECGYEAGCLGYTLYHQLTNAGLKCVILAPTTMLTQQGQRVKTDKRDARLIITESILRIIPIQHALLLRPGQEGS